MPLSWTGWVSMNNRWRSWILAALCLGALSGQQVNRLFWDGSDWERIPKLVEFSPEAEYLVKAAYLNGVLDGRLFYYLKTWAARSAFADSLYEESVDYLSTRELVRELDHFYEDPANRYLPVPTAILVANMIARQYPPETVDTFIRQSRRWINELQYQLELEGNAELLKQIREKNAPPVKLP
ncbi:MAG: hypothetical protein D6762_07030 [Candidatus Neomarinimicrobiota bacterium]|nr:MAG: hypothetical protein D6762_07030 [Candidatus Neomarinimicrobiota bacterium]